MKTLRKIALAGTIILGSLACKAGAQETLSNHFYNFSGEISEDMNDPSRLEHSNLIIKAQEGYELDEDEQRKVRGFFQNKAGSYIADRVIESLKKSRLKKIVEPIEKIVKGVEVPVPMTREKIKIKPDVDLEGGNHLQGGLDFSYRNMGVLVRSDGEIKTRVNFFKDDNKRLSLEAGYGAGYDENYEVDSDERDKGLYLRLSGGIIY